MKFGVGVMLTSFGIFWGAEGAGASGPAATSPSWCSSRPCWSFHSLSFACSARPRPEPRRPRRDEGASGPSGVWDFFVGDDWLTAAGVVLALALTALVSDGSRLGVVMPLAVALLLALSIWREARTAARSDQGG